MSYRETVGLIVTGVGIAFFIGLGLIGVGTVYRWFEGTPDDLDTYRLCASCAIPFPMLAICVGVYVFVVAKRRKRLKT